MKLKVCGMKYPENISHVAALQPDYFGFIFHEASSRNFENEIPLLTNSIKKVGVFVDKPLDYIKEKIRTHQLNAIQLHGNESPDFCKTLQDKQVKIIKVFSIKDEFDFTLLEPYENVCDYFLFDTKGKLPGGNGYTFNWDVLKKYPSTKPFFLSGGIGLDQIENLNTFQKSEASKHCYAIDVNSKFEIEPGLKNLELVKEFKSQL